MGLFVKHITFFSGRSAELLTEEVNEIFKDSGRWSFAHNLAGEFLHDGSFKIRARRRMSKGNYAAARLRGKILPQGNASICQVKASVSTPFIILTGIFVVATFWALLFVPKESISGNATEFRVTLVGLGILAPSFILLLSLAERRRLLKDLERRLKLTRVGEPK